jgi:glycosyltransferase involved in cell wall biosynthesis
VAAIRQWGLPEVTDDGRTALLADADDFEGYSDRIGRLISDEGLRRSLGRRAADYVRRRHDLNINYRRLEEYLQQTAEGRG